MALVEKHRIPYHEKKLGQLFCDRTAQDIVAMLIAECDRAGVEWRIPCDIGAVSRTGDTFVVQTSTGEVSGGSLVTRMGLTLQSIIDKEGNSAGSDSRCASVANSVRTR